METEKEVIPEGEQAEQITETVPAEENQEDTQDEGGVYRAKLNATNRFLEKEGYKFENGKWIKPSTTQVEKKEEVASTPNLSPHDVIALTKANIDVEDVDEVVRLSKVFGKSVSDTLKDKTVVSILRERTEERKTGNATLIKSQRGAQKTTGEDFLVKAETTGEIPTSPDQIRELAQARLNRLKNKNK